MPKRPTGGASGSHPPSTTARKGGKNVKPDAREEASFDFQHEGPERIIPEDQIELSEAKLDEEVARAITASDPNLPKEIVAYDFKDKEYKSLPPSEGDHLAIHFDQEGGIVHVESEECKAQDAIEKRKKEAAAEIKKQLIMEAKKEGEEFDPSTYVTKNQFNFSQRAAQTYNAPIKTRGISTEPPEMHVLKDDMTQWKYYDAYMEEYKKGGAAKEEGEESAPAEQSDDKAQAKEGGDSFQTGEMGRNLKIIERMVVQNAEDEIYMDFRYWEDISDSIRDNGLGSVLPLWRFANPRVKRKQVTAIVWNPKYKDLFGVGYGSYDFMRQSSGIVAIYTLKNTSFPEYQFVTESGVMALEFHPQHPSLVAVGCYDGTVVVFDIHRKEKKPLYQSDIKSGKHTDPIWQVKWADTDLSQELSFYSISTDGRVATWTLSKNELALETVMALKLVSSEADPDEETSLTGLAGGCCFDFNPHKDHLFLVGTEEGKIHLCSKAYSGQYLQTFDAHNMAVYAVKWNHFHPRVFLSCSADWTVRLWDYQVPKPIMTFDLANAVGDIAWAPYSSTVFAAVANDGRVHIYDLNVNKHEQLCEQKVVKRAKLTHVVFNPEFKVILVGDDKGVVNSLKLSPNLRKITPIPELPKEDKKKKSARGEGEEGKQEETKRKPLTRSDVEIEKMNKILTQADVWFEMEKEGRSGTSAMSLATGDANANYPPQESKGEE